MKLPHRIPTHTLVVIAGLFIIPFLLANRWVYLSRVHPLALGALDRLVDSWYWFWEAPWWMVAVRCVLLYYICLLLYRQVYQSIRAFVEHKWQQRAIRTNAERVRQARLDRQQEVKELATATDEVKRREAAEAARRREEALKLEQQATQQSAANQNNQYTALQGSVDEKVQHLTALSSEQIASKQQAAQQAAMARSKSQRALQEQEERWLQQMQAKQEAAIAEQKAAAAAARAASAMASTRRTPSTSLSEENKQAALESARLQQQTQQQQLTSPRPASTSPSTRRGTTITREQALEAEERQRRWLQQLQDELDAPERARREAMEAERQLREEQDAEYQASLEADRRRREEQEAAEAAEQHRIAAELSARQQLLALKQQCAASLPEEPDAADAQAVALRVRLPNGSTDTRRFLTHDTVGLVRNWVQSLDAMPSWQPSQWRLVSSYPKRVLEADVLVQDVAHGARQVAVFVEEA